MEMVWCSPFNEFTLSDLSRLFFIEGSLTILVALISLFVLPDFPSTSHRWLSPMEVRLAEKRMEEDAGIGDEGQTEVKSQRRVLFDALMDWKVAYMGLKYIILHFSQARPLIYYVKHHLYYHLRLIQRVLSHPYRYTWVRPNHNSLALRSTLGICNFGRVCRYQVCPTAPVR